MSRSHSSVAAVGFDKTIQIEGSALTCVRNIYSKSRISSRWTNLRNKLRHTQLYEESSGIAPEEATMLNHFIPL